MAHRHLTIAPDPRQLKAVRDAVLELAEPCLHAQAHLVALAVDEAVSNVIRHGGGTVHDGSGARREPAKPGAAQAGRGAIDVDIDADSGRLEVRIADGGPAYDPTTAVTDDLQARVRLRKRGGMGLSIIRRVMDEVHYARPQSSAGGRNELRLVKYFVRS